MKDRYQAISDGKKDWLIGGDGKPSSISPFSYHRLLI